MPFDTLHCQQYLKTLACNAHSFFNTVIFGKDNISNTMKLKHPIKTSRIILHCCILSLSCLAFSPAIRASESLSTLPPLAGLAQWLDPQADIQCLLPAHADPHHFQLSPHQVETLQHSTLLIRSSRDDGHWPSLHTSASTLDLWPSPATKHKHEDANSHVWLNPQAVISILPSLAQALEHAHPTRQASIAKQLTLNIQQAKQLWQTWQQNPNIHQLQKTGVMMQHPAWKSLFEALHIPVWSVLESGKHGQEYGPKKLEEALKLLNEHPQTVLIGDSTHNNRALLWLQRHHPSSKIITLDALGTCGEAWPALMQRNLQQLKITP